MVVAAKAIHLAAHYVDVNRPADALRVLGQAAGDALHDREYWIVRAEAFFLMELWDEGAAAASSGLALGPDDPELLNLLALCGLNAGRLADAETTLEAAVELDPESALLLSNLALVQWNGHRPWEAARTVERALELDPKYAFVLRVRALIAASSHLDDTATFVDALLAVDPGDRVGHELRGDLAWEQGRYALAARSYGEAARLEPGRRTTVELAREARVAGHPLLAPLRPIWRFGSKKAMVVFVALWLFLAAVGLNTAGVIVIASWFALCVFERIAPPAVRWWMSRQFHR